jgi:hypothetical protein
LRQWLTLPIKRCRKHKTAQLHFVQLQGRR